MSVVIVGRWGRNLAVRLPSDIVASLGINDGEQVEIETRDGDIVIRRDAARAQALAEAAAEEMIAESEHYTLGVSAVELVNEDRR